MRWTLSHATGDIPPSKRVLFCEYLNKFILFNPVIPLLRIYLKGIVKEESIDLCKLAKWNTKSGNQKERPASSCSAMVLLGDLGHVTA